MEMEIYELLNDDLESKRNLKEAIALLKLKNFDEIREKKGHGIVARTGSSEKGNGVVFRTRSVERCATRGEAYASSCSQHRRSDVVDTRVNHDISINSAHSPAARNGGPERSKDNDENSSEMSSELTQTLTKLTQQMDYMSLQLQGLSALPSLLHKQAIDMFSS